MAFHQLTYEQARLACNLGHSVRHPGMPVGAFVMMRPQASQPSQGYTQAPWTPTQQEKLRNDWEIL